MADPRHEKLVSLASKYNTNTVPYDVLMSALKISNEREFEDFIIQAIYQGVVQGRLNPVKRHFEVHDWNSEKLDEPDLQFMANTLKYWHKHSEQFLNAIGSEVERSNNFIAELSTNEKSVNDEAEMLRQSLVFEEGRKVVFAKDGIAHNKAASKPETKRFKSGGAKSKRNN